MGENIFWHILKRIGTDLKKIKKIPPELDGIEKTTLADVLW
ncbi:MAG: hypothetical protein R2874_13385 [Desulfobacterales bacterium]